MSEESDVMDDYDDIADVSDIDDIDTNADDLDDVDKLLITTKEESNSIPCIYLIPQKENKPMRKKKKGNEDFIRQEKSADKKQLMISFEIS